MTLPLQNSFKTKIVSSFKIHNLITERENTIYHTKPSHDYIKINMSCKDDGLSTLGAT